MSALSALAEATPSKFTANLQSTTAVTTATHARLPLANAVSDAKAQGERSQNDNKHIHSWHFA
jgi:hypothetical protein